MSVKSLIAPLLLTLLAVHSDALANASETDNPHTLTLGFLGPFANVLQGSKISIPVTYTGPALRVSSLNLRFAYNDQSLLPIRINWGSMFRRIPTEPVFDQLETLDSTLEDGMNATVHLMALSKIGDTDITPDEMFEFNDGDTLVALDFRVSNDRSLRCQVLPLRWLWLQCEDNSVATQGETLSSLSVADKRVNKWRGTTFQVNLTDSLTRLPSLAGAPANCTSIDSVSTDNQKSLSFVNGGAWMPCYEVFPRGDINLNGIVAEYDDMESLAKFITLGKSAFTLDTMAQFFMMDYYADGIPGDLSDLVLLLREVTGNRKPNFYSTDLSYQDTVILEQDNSSVTANRELAALLLVFDGPAKVTVVDESLHVTEGQINGDTYVLVHGHYEKTGNLPLIAPGEIIETNGVLKRAEAANYKGYKLHTIITH